MQPIDLSAHAVLIFIGIWVVLFAAAALAVRR